MIKIILLLITVFTAFPSSAQQDRRLFDIEVLIFENNNNNQIAEKWPQDLKAIDIKKSGSITDYNFLANKQVELIQRDDYTLEETYQTLNENNHRVLWYKAWRQGDEPKSESPTFLIRAGDYYPTQKQYQVYGTFQIYVQHYLFAETNLDFTIPIILNENDDSPDAQLLSEPEEVLTPTWLNSHRLEQKVQMRSNNTYYIDHPFLGIIIKVSRVDS